MAKAVFREPDREGLAEAGFIGVDMHFHTDRSLDSIARINHVLAHARKLGIGVAMTDHNEVSGGVTFFRNKERVLVIPGVELTSSEGTHTLLFFHHARDCRAWAREVLTPLKKRDPFRLPATTAELYERARDFNALVCAPHPFGPGATGVHKIRVTQWMERRMDCVEGINAYCTRTMNRRAVRWAERLGKPVTAGSDGHVLAELGQGLLFCQADTAAEFLEQVRKGKGIAMGVENSLYEKAVVGVEKEEAFVGRAARKHRGVRLLKDQLGAEWDYVKKLIRRGWMHEKHTLFHRHHG